MKLSIVRVLMLNAVYRASPKVCEVDKHLDGCRRQARPRGPSNRLFSPLTPKLDGASPRRFFEGSREGAVIKIAADLRNLRNCFLGLQQKARCFSQSALGYVLRGREAKDQLHRSGKSMAGHFCQFR